MSERPVGSRPAQSGRAGLATQAALVAIAVAVVATLITGVVSVGLVRGAADRQAQRTLGREAQLLANSAAPFPHRLRATALVRQLRSQVVRVLADGQTRGLQGYLLPPRVRSAAAAGRSVDEMLQLGGAPYLVESRPVPFGHGSVVLLQRAATVGSELTSPLRNRLLVALLAGLLAAVLAGVLLARRLARPLQQAAAAAHRLAGGSRDVRLEPSGPTEVAEVAEALNRLGAALADSEDRQRGFLLSVSHELRTPLTAVRGYAEALADGVVPEEQIAAVGATMVGEADRLERLVSDLLDLARLGAQDFRLDLAPVDLAALQEEAVAVWRDRCARVGVELRAESPAEPLLATTDRTRVRQILDGLAENALRVTPAGAPIVLALRREGEQAVLEVRDGGPGLTDDDLAVAFERSALHDRYRGVRRVGTGIGLALVAGLAGRLGGRAEAGHAPEGGARFAVRLPLQTAPPSQRADGRPAGTLAATRLTAPSSARRDLPR